MALIPFDGELDAPVPGLVPFTGKLDGEPEGIVDTVKKGLAGAKNYDQAIASGINEGIANTIAGAGTFIQAPAANTLSGLASAAALVDRGITSAANFVSPGSAALNDGIQDTARSASRFAAEERAKNADSNIVANAGLKMQDFGREHAKYAQEQNKQFNPELIRQQQNMAGTEGFIGALEGIKDNPMAFTQTLARSAPDMMIGAGVAKGVASGIAAAGGSAARQVAGASTAGILSEAGSSAYQGREGVYQQVAGMPIDRLAASPRFNEILAQTGDAAKSREILANELADQVPLLSAAGTAMGSVITNKLFGGDTSARMIAGVQKTTGKDVLKNMGQESTEEAFQGVPEDLAQHGAVVQADPSAKFDLGKTIAENAAAGLAMGTGGSAISFARDNFGKQAGEIPPAPPPLPDTGPMSRSANLAISTGAAAQAAAAQAADVLGVPEEEGALSAAADVTDTAAGAADPAGAIAEQVGAPQMSEQDAVTSLNDLSKAWDQSNRTSRANEWMAGAAASNPAFSSLAADDVPAHGMAKVATLGEAVRNLVNMLTNGVDPNRTLYYDSLTSNSPGAGAASGTSGGHAYRDGPFIITFRNDLNGRQPTAADITGVLVNPAHSELVAPLQSMFPNLVVRDYSGAAEVAAASRTQAPAASNTENKSGPTDMQNRDRSRAASVMQMQKIAQNPDYELASIARDSNGAPMVATNGSVQPEAIGKKERVTLPDGTKINTNYAVVEADTLSASHFADGRENPNYGKDGKLTALNNGRTAGLVESYRIGRAENYRAALEADTESHGISREVIAGMKAPVLVRLYDAATVDKTNLGARSNQASALGMGADEQSRSDAAMIDTMDDLRPTDDGDFITSRDFIRRFIARLPGTEQAGMIDAGGQLSQTGYTRIRNAVLAKAYGDSPVLGRMVESLDDNMRNIGKALMRSAPEIAKLRHDVSEGALFDADVTPDLLSAVEEMSRIKDSGQSVAEYLSQGSLMGDATSPEAREMLKFLAVNMRRPGKIVEFIRNYTEALRAAGNPNQGSLLGEVAAPAKGEIINSALEKADGQAEAVIPTAGDSGKQGANQGANQGAENIGDKGAGRPAGEEPASPPSSNGSTQGDETRLSRAPQSKELAAANRIMERWESLVGDDVDISLGGSLVSGLWVQKGDEPVDLDLRFLVKSPSQEVADKIAAATGLVFKKAIQVNDHPTGMSTAYMIEGAVTEDGITFDVEGSVRNKAYVGWAKYYPEYLSPKELEEFKANKARLKADKPAYKALKAGVLDEVKARVVADGRLLTVDGMTYDTDAPNFGFPAPAMTLNDGDPLLVETDTLPGDSLVLFDGEEMTRSGMRELIVDKAFKSKEHAPNSRKPIAYVMAGGGASGKGVIKTYLKAKGSIQQATAIEIDPDEIKAKIPEYDRIIAAGDSRGASIVHEESSTLAKQVKARAIADRYDLLLDVTLGNQKKGEAYIKELKDAGYEVRLFGVTVAPEKAVVRALVRAINTKRMVPIKDLLTAHKGFSGAFDSYAELADQAELYSTDDGINHIAEKVGESLEIKDIQAYNELAERSKINDHARTIREILGATGGRNDRNPDAAGRAEASRNGAAYQPGNAGSGSAGSRVSEGSRGGTESEAVGERGDLNANLQPGEIGAQGKKSGAVQGTVGQRGTASIRDGAGGRDRLGNRNADNGTVEQGQDGGKEPDGGSGATQGVRGDGEGIRAGRPAGVPAGRDAGEWVAFPAETGTLGIPRADMPQIKSDARPALISFLKSRGIEYVTEDVQAESLRPTQAEFSTKKALNWVETREGVDRSVLASSDGFVLDGHHQWIAALSQGEAVKAIHFDAPIDKLLAAVYQFPGAKRGEGATGGREQARQDFQAALADLGALFRQINPGVRMLTPEEKVKLMPTLVKLFESGIRQVGYSMKDLIAHVRAAMKASADEFVKKHWNKIDEKTYREAAAVAIDNVQNAPPEVGQTADMFAIPKPGPAPVQADMFAALEKVAPEVFKKPPVENKVEPEKVDRVQTDKPKAKPEKSEKSAPAGRDIPPKTGRNYAFGDDDLTYAGSWIQKATQNVEAVELLVKLDQEKRQATREEQVVLAKFIGWGASDLANSLFGDKLNKPLQEIYEYEVALAAFDKIGRDYLRNGGNYRGDYGDSGYYSAVGVLRNAGKILGYGPTPERITKAEVIAAKPDMTAKKWNELRDRLKAVMSEEEWADAARSTQYAHYTSKPIVKSMMSALQRMGFKGGTILEPGAGIGVFPGLMPVDMANNSAYTGIEFDAITGRILKQLFPDERILVESFVDTALPQNYYDVAFGNPPFGNIPILADPKYRKYAFSLHDYFFAKTMDSVKPGGLVQFVTSRYTMDKLDDKARAYLAERADLVGAIRLPQTAFKKNAGTDVVTDVLFLRKKVPGETFEHGQAWAKSVPITINGRQFNINEYFHAHPEMVLGKNSDAGKMANSPDPQYTVEAIEGDIDALFDKAAGTLPDNIYQAIRDSAAEDAVVRDLDFNPKAKKEGNYYVTDAGVLMVREGGIGKRAEIKSAGNEAIIKDFVPLRDALKQAHFDQLNNGEWEKSLVELQKAYKAFVKKNGQIHQHTTYMQNVKVDELDDEGNPTGKKVADKEQRYRFPVLNAIKDDPDWTLVAALESFNEETGAISETMFLTDRVLQRRAPAKVETPTDAMLQVLNDIGKVDISETAKRIGLSEQETIDALGALVYNDPSSGWVTADDYLSGDIRKKLKAARAAADTDKRYQRNVEALISALPNSKTAAEITPQIGMSWIPTSTYEQFLREKAGVRATVTFNERTGQWDVQAVSGHKGLEATQDWGTDRRNAADILGYALSGAPVRIMSKVGFGKDQKDVFDSVATQAVTEKLNNMREAFKTWLWEDPARVDTLVPIYNEKFNSIVPRSFNGDHLTLPGVSERWMKLGVFPHVKRGAWRIIQQGNTYLAHAVGSGKTNQMIISAMEQKRLGLIQKPMMVVPNHMLKQFSSEWMDLYPAARLMVADETSFTGDNRRRFVARAALSDLDGVIITHSAFKLLDLDPAFKQRMIEQQLEYMRAAYKEAGENPDKLEFEKTTNEKGVVSVKLKSSSKSKDPKVKQIERKIERYQQKLEALMSSEGKDTNVRFDEMGVDMLYVDEAHEFRKLDFSTQRQVKGIDSSGSDMAFDLHMKVQWLRENKNPKRNLVMASGTPVTNTLAELYSVQRFMAPDVLAERGLEEFDQWASMFGAESTNIEPDASGKYGPVTRFNKFVNVGELTQMFREFADVLTSDYLAAMLGDKRPKVKGGSRSMIITPKTPEYTAFQKDVLQPRMKASREWKWSKDEPNNPDPIINIIGDGRLAAIDLRFMDPKAPNDPDSKLNKMIDEVIRVYKETADYEYTTDGKPGSKVEPAKGAVQMVFAELGFGSGVAANRGFNARAWFEKRLRDAGVKPEHVAFMSDNKKSTAKVKLFRDMNAGRVRIAVGSSKNMGTGVNAQQRLVALHHLDSPWYPADLEQREGRIVRQGNKHKEVELYAYAMKGSYDEQMWSTLARKQFFIDQALSGDANIREIEDLGESSQFEIAAAMVADDPRVLQLAGLRAEVEKLTRLRYAHEDQRGRMQRDYTAAGARLGWIERKLEESRADAAKVQDITGDNFTGKADGKTLKTRKEWGQALMARYKDLSDHMVEKETVIGSISGFDVVYVARMSQYGVMKADADGNTKMNHRFESAVALKAAEPILIAQDVTSDPVGVSMRAQSALAGIARAPAALESEANDLKAKRNALEPRLTAPFPMIQMLLDKENEAAVLEEAIVASGKEKTGLEREQELEDAWQARTGAITPLFSRRAQAETPEFKAWFGDSKVVDADGKPLVVYHATTYGDFNEFTKAEQRKGMAGFGFYFSDSNGSNVYAEHSQRFKMDRSWKGEPKRVNIMPAFLRMDNPLRADNIADVARRFNDKGAFGVGRSVAGLSDDAKTAIQLAGYDGVITNEYVRKKRDGSLEIVSPHDKGAIKHPVYVVFEPTQIKSAIGNNGQFDPENPDIGFSRGNGASMAVGDLKATVDRVSRGFKNLPKVHVFASPADLSAKGPVQKALADFIRKAGAWDDVEGAMHQGEIYLFASGLASAERAEHVLATHEVTHYGLRGAIGKGLDSALHHIWLNNAAVRKEAAAIKQRNGLASNTEAVEEVLADMPAADLVKLKGWRRVVMVARDWLRNAGATNLAGRIDSWLNSTLDDQQKADLFVADLVNAARNFARNGKPASVMDGTRLADGSLAEDVAAQEKWLTAEAKARGYAGIEDMLEKNYPLFEKLAAKWREQHPADALLSRNQQGQFELVDIKTGKVVGGPYSSIQRARAWRERRDQEYGAIRYRIREIETGRSRLSRSSQTANQTAAERADAILSKSAATWRPVDAIMRGLTRATRFDKATGFIYDKAGALIDRYTPEQIKAGVVSDYGVPEAVIDRRIEMQGKQRAQIRKAGALLEKLSTLTRAESRLAYEWMTNNDTKAAAYFEAQLPPESVKIMAEIKDMIDALSQEAVTLGQLSPEAFKRNRFEYLHRSYVKHTAELTKGEANTRRRAIAILGEQYKGRGMTDAVDMKKVQNSAPEWWGRKLQDGKADKGLIGEKFVRFERRAPTGAGVMPLQQAQGPGNTNPQKPGKLLEVAYWPAGEKAPAKYAAWDEAGTWEVRDTKGDKLIVWRDFTKAERVAMGEIDEARYAIAKTLHGMIHDVETGKYLEWVAQTYGKLPGEAIDGEIVEASDRMRDTFAPGTWVQVPDTKVQGTQVAKYGKLAGQFIPGPIWNDVRQTVGFRFKPLGELYGKILSAWKTSKTALSPAVHTNNIMANFVMADWHDVTAGHIAKALRIILGTSQRAGKGLIGRTGNAVSRAGMADAEAAREIINRFQESGANMGSWVNAELQKEQLEPLLDALEHEIGTAGQHAPGQVGAFAALQLALQLRFPSAWEAAKPTAGVRAVTTEARSLIDLYEAEDQVFRLAAWLKAKEDGESDLVAGRRARKSFLDYHINAPWIQAMRQTALPFISFSYRAIPMALEIAAKKPHKLMKLAMFAGLVNALGYLLSGGDEDDERRLLPEEKAGRVWGLVPKLVRMPWNDKFGSPVFLDIRRFVPVGDIFDTGQNHGAIPMLPFAVPGGPLAIISEVVANKSQFTGRPITLETDTGAEKATKLADHLYKAFAPNIVILPGTYAFTGVVNAGSGRTDSFGREQSVVQAGLTSFGVKVGSYPKDVLMLNTMRQAEGQMMEIDRQITQEKRELQRRGVSEEEFRENIDALIVKKRGISERLQKKMVGN